MIPQFPEIVTHGLNPFPLILDPLPRFTMAPNWPHFLFFFQLFVRLFVDENLDRLVPISKQPKDKVQAILEACNRQFVEFHERARKRIRTYLKSCRRMRRCKDSNGVEQVGILLYTLVVRLEVNRKRV